MSNYQNFSFSSFLISLDAPTQISVCHSLSYQQINKSKQASKKQTHFLKLQAYLILLSLHKQIHFKETLQRVGARVHSTFIRLHFLAYFTIILISWFMILSE